jgi:DNA-binding transcriptional ArsR family regulator
LSHRSHTSYRFDTTHLTDNINSNRKIYKPFAQTLKQEQARNNRGECLKKESDEETEVLRKAVKIVERPKILADPVRREILRLLNIKPQTSTQLADRLNLSKSTVGYHIVVLRRTKLIKIKWAKPGIHGILEKYYEPVALVFIEDYKHVPDELKKYFLSIHMERLRGVFGAFQLVGDMASTFQTIRESWEQTVKIPSDFDLLAELGDESLKYMTQIGQKYETLETDLDAETLLTKIYSEALRAIITTGVWSKVFANVSEISTLVVKAKNK